MRYQTNESGAITIGKIVMGVVTASAVLFGLWSIVRYNDLSSGNEARVSDAIADAEGTLRAEIEQEFAEDAKKPFDLYKSPSSIGSIEIHYPKTWSAYAIEREGNAEPLDAYFHPSFVPGTNTKYALRVLVDERQYEQVISAFGRPIDRGEVTTRPLTINEVTGQRFDGQISNDTIGSIFIFPLRDKTIRIWTESEVYRGDFEKILDKLVFEK